MANKYIMKCSTSLAKWETHIKLTLRFHLTPMRIAIIKKANNKSGEEVEENRTLTHSWWKHKVVQPLWKSTWKFIKKINKTKNTNTI
jgi:hypothetical protein